MLLIEIFIILILLTIVFWLGSLIFAQAAGAPTVDSSKKAVIDALKLADPKKDELLVDLGCGTAKVLILAAKEFEMRGIGIDRSPYCYLISRWNVFWSGEGKRIKIVCGGFEKVESELKEADVVYVYLLSSVNRKIEKWLFDVIGDKTRLISLSFDFKFHHPIKEVVTKTLWRETKARLYEKS